MFKRMFRWNLDEDGDLVLSFIGLIHVVYYKWNDDSIVRFGRKNYTPATKEIWRRIHRTEFE